MKNDKFLLRILLSIPRRNKRLVLLFQILTASTITIALALSLSLYLFHEQIYARRMNEIERRIQSIEFKLNTRHLENAKADGNLSTSNALLNLEKLSLLCEKKSIQNSGMSLVEQVSVLFELVSGR